MQKLEFAEALDLILTKDTATIAKRITSCAIALESP
jgi:hypothetical protein